VFKISSGRYQVYGTCALDFLAITYSKFYDVKVRWYFILLMVLCGYAAHSQAVDSIQYDLDRLSDSEFFKEYSVNAGLAYPIDMEVTQTVWSLGHVRGIVTESRLSHRKVKTMIIERPSKSSSSFLIRLYRAASQNHFVLLGNYRLDLVLNSVQFKAVDDEGWVDVE
jgi:hypothetical protein